MKQIVKWDRTLMRLCIYVSLLILTALFSTTKVNAQASVSYAEYYLDQDPGLNLGVSIPITASTNVQDVAVNLDVSGLSLGVHIFGTRARTSSGIWSMSHYWFLFKPYIAITPGTVTNVTRVEYFVDNDPGQGSGISVPITPGTNLANITFSIDPVPLGLGVHIIGSRTLTADGSWSHTNFWLFYKPYSNIPTPGTPGNVNYVEYFVDNDPGIANGIPISVTPGLNLSDVNLPINITGLSNGIHIVGTRAKDVNGNWSKTNFWLFVKPYSNIQGPVLANTSAVEYYLDFDPGYGNGIPVTVPAGTNLPDYTFNVNVSTIIAGSHFISVRAKDVNGSWSMVNSWTFSIPGTPPVLSTLVSTTALCAGAAINVGYQLSAPVTFNANNTFIAQLSNNVGNFLAPVVIGSTSATNNSGAFPCVIPANTGGSGSYRIRVISTSQPIVGTDNGSNITVFALPSDPTITSPAADTTVCQGNQLSLVATNVTGSPQWLLNGVAIPGATSSTYTVSNATSANAGAYSLRVTSTAPCNVVSSTINIAINTNVPATPTVTPNGNIGVCLGNTINLSSSSVTNNQWYKDGILIAGATGQSINVGNPGTYTVRVSNGTCAEQSSNSAVISIGIPPTTPTVTVGGPTTFCQGGNVNFTSSAFSGNQWLRNGIPIPGATSTSYAATQSGYYKTMVSSASCNVYSDSTLVTANPTLSPSVTVVASNNNVPATTSITITATPVNGGSAPQYTFYLNNVVVQTGSLNTYTSNAFTNNSTVYAALISNVNCASTPNATSNTLVITLLNNVLISGRVSNPQGLVIPSINVRLSGGITDSIPTDNLGKYSFSVYQQHNYGISPNKNNDVVKSSGVNVQDVLLMQAHILGTTLLNSAYKVIAADVNTDNAVNIFDLILVKRLVLGIDTSFPGGRLWAFVDSTQTFPNPNNPFPYVSSKSYSNISASQVNQSFIGLKLGDVNQDWAPVAGQNSRVTYHQPLELYYDTIYLDNSNQVRVKVRVAHFDALNGIQFTLGFNPQSLSFSGIENMLLPFEHNDRNASRGIITFIWADRANQAHTLANGTVLFEMVFNKQHDFAKEDILILPLFTPPLAFSSLSESMGVVKTTGIIMQKIIQPIVTRETLDINPNPTSGIISISITSKEQKNIILEVTDIAGKLLLQKVFAVIKGNNLLSLDLRQNRPLAAGLYNVKAIGLENVLVKEILVVNK